MIILRKLSQIHPDIPLVWKLFSESFHEHERIIFSDLLDCPQATLYGIYPDEESLQFAGFFIVLDCERIVYLYYLAVCPEMRSTGIGGKALHTLIDMYNGRQITLAYESILQPSDNAGQRKRRQAFYLRNGLRDTDVKATVFGAQFKILTLPLGSAVSREEVRQKYAALYRALLPPALFQEKVFIYNDDE